MQININIAVDVVAALSDQTLHQHVFLMDDGPFCSSCQGSEYLSTACQPGQTIQWKVCAIDLQTPVSIKNIAFLDAPQGDGGDNDPDLNAWVGIVPCYMKPGLPYRYRLELQMGNGKHAVLSTEAPSLLRIS